MSKIVFYFFVLMFMRTCGKAPVYHFPDVGTMMEPYDIALKSQGNRYISVLVDVSYYHLITAIEGIKTPCVGTPAEFFRETFRKEVMPLIVEQKSFLDRLQNHGQVIFEFDCIDSICSAEKQVLHQNETQGKRGKRGIPIPVVVAIVGLGVSVGNSLYSYVQGQQLSHHMDSYIKEQRRFNDIVQNQMERGQEFTKLSAEYYMKNNLLVERIINETSRYQCELSVMQKFRGLIGEYKTDLRLSMMSLNDAASGRLTPNLLSFTNAEALISDYSNGFQSTIYRKDILMFYSLSKIMFVRPDKNREILHMIIETPIIRDIDVVPAYRIFNYGWIEDGIYQKLSLPPTALVDTSHHEGTASEYDPNLCDLVDSHRICQRQFSTSSSNSKCLTGLFFFNSTMECDVDGGHGIQTPEVIVTRTGILYPVNADIEVIEDRRGMMVKKGKSRRGIGMMNFISYNEFDIISIDKVYYKSTSVVAVVETKTLPVPDLTEGLSGYIRESSVKGILHDMGQLSEEYKIKSDSNKDIIFFNPGDWEHNSNFLWVSLILAIIIVTFILFRIYKKVRSYKTNRSNNTLPMIPLHVTRSGNIGDNLTTFIVPSRSIEN